MAGYVDPALGRSQALADLISLIGNDYRNAEYFDFGIDIHPLRGFEEARQFATPVPYNCSGQACDALQSWIDKALTRMSEDGPDRLTILISDLWLDNRSHHESVEVALGTPLRRILDSGRAIGVAGIRAPFKGFIDTAIPRVGAYRGATERPLFVIVAGPPDKVSAFHRSLVATSSPALTGNRLRFSLFSTALPDPAANAALTPTGAGVSVWRPRLDRKFGGTSAFRIEKARASTYKASLATEISRGEGLPAGLVWSGQPIENTLVWQLSGGDLGTCEKDMWTRIVALPNAWSASDASGRFAIDPAVVASLNPGTYYVVGELGVSGLRADNPVTSWMSEWSVTEEAVPALVQAHPTSFKALKLDRLRNILENQLGEKLGHEPRITRRFGFILDVKP